MIDIVHASEPRSDELAVWTIRTDAARGRAAFERKTELEPLRGPHLLAAHEVL